MTAEQVLVEAPKQVAPPVDGTASVPDQSEAVVQLELFPEANPQPWLF